MKKIKAIIWATWFLITSPFRRKVTEKEAIKTLVEDFGYKGQFRRPFKNAIAYEYDPKEKTTREIIMIDARAFQTPGTVLIWASNLKTAKKKGFKIGYHASKR